MWVYVFQGFFLFVPIFCMAVAYILMNNLISPLRHLPTKAVREKYPLGIVMLFPCLKNPYSKKGYVSVIFAFQNSEFYELNMTITFLNLRNNSMMLQAAQDTFLGI